MASIFYVSIFLPIMAFKLGADPSDPAQLLQLQTNCTISMWAGLLPAAMLGGLASYFRLRFFLVTVVDRFRTAPKNKKSK